MKVYDIEVSKIKENPYQTRESLNAESLKILTKSIRERGLFNPISLLRDQEEYIIINGHRRLAAFKKLRKKTIPAFIKDRQQNKELIIDLVHENLIREDLTPIEKGKAIKLLLSQIKSTNNDVDRMKTLINLLRNWKKRGYIPESRREKTKGFKDNDIFQLMEILKSIGISENNAVTYLFILSLPDYIRERIIFYKKGIGARGKINVRQAEQLTRVKDKEFQKYLFERSLLGKSTIKSIQALVNLHIEKVERGEWKGHKKYSYYGQGKIKNDLDKLNEISSECERMSSKLTSFKVDTLLKLDETLENDLFISSLSDLKKQLNLLENRIDEKLIDKGFKPVPKKVDTFEINVSYQKRRGHYRYTFPMKIAKQLKFSKDKKEILKLNILERK